MPETTILINSEMMDNSPLLTPNGPRFAPPRMHVRNASHSPTRKRFADDLLSDLSPATTLEAFTNPSGKLKASIEAATPSERAFGIRATVASKKIQEWVEELSDWPWPEEGGSVGFEMPATKRRRLSNPFVTSGPAHYEETGSTGGNEPRYIGSLLAEQVGRYEGRIDEIETDMEDLNVEEIKRQVFDTHFSPRSRPSSSCSNAPMPQLLSSFVKMDDFAAIVTSTVLQSLPYLSRLMRLMDVWSIRLSVLQKVPPLLLALEDTETALKSGWNAIENPGIHEEYLSRETFDIMRNILREKVTALGRDLDFLLDTLEGREDTLPDRWLDRMEDIENDYGSWDVAGDQKVREGEWARLSKRRKEEKDAKDLLEAQEAEIARQQAEEEAKEQAERIARQTAEDEARRQVERDAREVQAAEDAQMQAERDAQKAKLEVEALEAAKLKEARKASERQAKIDAEKESAILEAELEAKEAASLKTQLEAEVAETARLQAKQEAEEARTRAVTLQTNSLAERQAQEDADNKARLEAEALEAERLKSQKEFEAAATQMAQREAEANSMRLKAEQEAEARVEAEALEAKVTVKREADEAAKRQAKIDNAVLEAAKLKAAEERLQANNRALEAEALEAERLKSEQEAAKLQTQALELARIDVEQKALQAAKVQAKIAANSQEAARKQLQLDAEEASRLDAEKGREDNARPNAQHETEVAQATRFTAEKVSAREEPRKDLPASQIAQASLPDSTDVNEPQAKHDTGSLNNSASKQGSDAEVAEVTAERDVLDTPYRDLQTDLLVEEPQDLKRGEFHASKIAAAALPLADPSFMSLTTHASSAQAETGSLQHKAKEDAVLTDRHQVSDEPNSRANAEETTSLSKHHKEAPAEFATEQALADPETDWQQYGVLESDIPRSAEDAPSEQRSPCSICEDFRDEDVSSALPTDTRNSMGVVLSTVISPLGSKFSDAIHPNIAGYSPYDGIDENGAIPVTVSMSEGTRSEPQDYRQTELDSPIHLNDTPRSESPSPPSPISSDSGNDESTAVNDQYLPRFGHGFSNAVRRASSTHAPAGKQKPLQQQSKLNNPPDLQNDTIARATLPEIRHEQSPEISTMDGTRDLLSSSQDISMRSTMDGWVVIGSSDDEDTESSRFRDEHPRLAVSMHSRPDSSGDHRSTSSLILGYSTTDVTPEIQEAEPAEYFQPIASPVKGISSKSAPATPIVSPAKKLDLSTLDGPVSPGSPFVNSPHGMQAIRSRRFVSSTGDDCEVCDHREQDFEMERPSSVPTLARKMSIAHISSGRRRISIPKNSRRDSISSETSTVMNDRAEEPPSPPLASPIEEDRKSPIATDASPTAGRVGLRHRTPSYTSPPNSPARSAKLSPQRFLQRLKSPKTSPEPTSPSTPVVPVDAPAFANIDITTTPIITSPKKVSTDEQIQQQISSLLESIPASIRLTSEPEGPGYNTQSLRPKKARRSVTPNFRPSSSMSNYSTSTSYSRAPTPGPQFTLAPAFGKTSQRTRTHNGNPEIKLYHLSRSSGEAPIKLFVRLVGEHGERVMVRVGGGWADLGEYLKEYASHHGRRSGADAGDVVEIQGLPSRVVSTSSTTSTLRGSGRDTPGPRPLTSMERERPGSNLNVRKTRKSFGQQDPSPIPPRINEQRFPSTPLPTTAHRAYETPPSAASVVSVASSNSGASTGPSGRNSRLSWTEEDSSLGLAGPKSKKIVISERDQEWVESMKEKVRLASAEKERRERLELAKERKTSFGEMDRVGGTKRLFRKA